MTVQIILKNSNVVDKRPAATQLANGELSLNYNEAGAFLCCVDSAGNIQQVGGIKVSADAPGDPVRGTMWLQTPNRSLFVHDGDQWLPIATGSGGGGGGGGDITQVNGGQGINTTELGGVVTVDAAIDTGRGLEFQSGQIATNIDTDRGVEFVNGAISTALDGDRGLEFESGRIAISAGANLSFDGQGRLQADASAMVYRGTVDLVAGAVPANPVNGDTHANTVAGAMSADWQTATGEGATAVQAGDLVVWNGTIWTYIPTGGNEVRTDLGVDNITDTTLDVTSSTGDDATLPAATDTTAGLMTAADKEKLDGYTDDPLWDRTGTVLSPSNAGDDIVTTGRIRSGATVDLGSITTAPSVSRNFAFSADAQYGGHALVAADDAGGVVNAQVAAQNFSVRTATTGNPPAQRLNVDNFGVFTLGNGTTNAVTLDPGSTDSPLVRAANGDVTVGDTSAVHVQLAANGTITAGSSLLDRQSFPNATTLTIADRGTRGAQWFGNGWMQAGGTLSGDAINDTPAISLNPGAADSPLVRDSAGRLGVGTSDPQHGVSLLQGQAFGWVSSVGNAKQKIEATAQDGIEFYTGGTPTRKAVLDADGRLLVGTASTTTNTRAMFTGSSGNQSGSGRIYLANGGNSLVVGEGLGGLYFSDSDGANYGSIVCGRDGGTWSGSSKPTTITFNTTPDGSTTPVERMRIDNVGRLDCFSSNSNTNYFFTASQNADTSNLIVARHSSTGYGNGVTCFSVQKNGDVENTNNEYGAISDIKLKENIVDAKSQWDDIKGIRLRNYNFKEETGHETHTQLGVVAQELEAVCPKLVKETKDTETVEIPVLDEDGVQVMDEEGNPSFTTEERETGEVTKSVAYSVLYMKAVGALQEAMERIETLEARLAKLEGGASKTTRK